MNSLKIKHWLIILSLLTGLSSCFFNAKEQKAELAFSCLATTGEGSIWHPGRNSLFWVDIEGKKLFEYIPKKKGCRVWRFNRMISTVVPETDSTVIVALQDEIVRVNLNRGINTSVIPIPDKNGDVRCNDGKCDPAGRLWVGTMSLKHAKGNGILYTVTSNGEINEKLKKVTTSNGIVWSSDKKFMYYNDTPTNRIARYRYNNSTGEILFDGIAVNIPKGTGSPDGMTIDSNDNLWVAQWGGSGVYCYSPYTGELLRKVEVPALHVASCAFGGAHLDTLYITTARAGLNKQELEKYPLSGSLFKCVPGVKGVAANSFGLK